MTRHVRFFPDIGAPWCLWEAGASNSTPYATQLGASQLLEDRITGWYEFWERHCNWENGFDSPGAKATWIAHGDGLLVDLRRELQDSDIRVTPLYAE